MAKKNSVPARQHQYVKRKKKFIEMPKEQFIKICVIVVVVIAAIVAAILLIRAFDGHLDIVDGNVVKGGDNWLIANTQTASDPRYFKIGEAGEAEGFTRAVDAEDSTTPTYTYTSTDEGSPVQAVSVSAVGVSYEQVVSNVQSFYAMYSPSAVFGEVNTEDIAGRHARSFIYDSSYENPEPSVAEVEAETTPAPEETPAPDAADEAATQTTTTVHTRTLYVCLEAGRNRSIVLTTSVNADSAEAFPDQAALISAIEPIATQITVE